MEKYEFIPESNFTSVLNPIFVFGLQYGVTTTAIYA